MNSRNGSAPLIQTTLIIAAIVVLAAIVLIIVDSLGERTRDTQRIAAISSLQNFLSLYASNNSGDYPPTLSALVPEYVPALPKEPLSESSAGYSYAAIGSSTSCTSYHLGVSLEDTSNKVLNTDSNASPQPVCAGSAPDFSGLSSAPAGTPCAADAGNGGHESCYDVTP